MNRIENHTFWRPDEHKRRIEEFSHVTKVDSSNVTSTDIKIYKSGDISPILINVTVGDTIDVTYVNDGGILDRHIGEVCSISKIRNYKNEDKTILKIKYNSDITEEFWYDSEECIFSENIRDITIIDKYCGSLYSVYLSINDNKIYGETYKERERRNKLNSTFVIITSNLYNTKNIIDDKTEGDTSNNTGIVSTAKIKLDIDDTLYFNIPAFLFTGIYNLYVVDNASEGISRHFIGNLIVNKEYNVFTIVAYNKNSDYKYQIYNMNNNYSSTGYYKNVYINSVPDPNRDVNYISTININVTNNNIGDIFNISCKKRIEDVMAYRIFNLPIYCDIKASYADGTKYDLNCFIRDETYSKHNLHIDIPKSIYDISSNKYIVNLYKVHKDSYGNYVESSDYPFDINNPVIHNVQLGDIFKLSIDVYSSYRYSMSYVYYITVDENLYDNTTDKFFTLNLEDKSYDIKKEIYCRVDAVSNHQFTINGTPLLIRGKHNVSLVDDDGNIFDEITKSQYNNEIIMRNANCKDFDARTFIKSNNFNIPVNTRFRFRVYDTVNSICYYSDHYTINYYGDGDIESDLTIEIKLEEDSSSKPKTIINNYKFNIKATPYLYKTNEENKFYSVGIDEAHSSLTANIKLYNSNSKDDTYNSNYYLNMMNSITFPADFIEQYNKVDINVNGFNSNADVLYDILDHITLDINEIVEYLKTSLNYKHEEFNKYTVNAIVSDNTLYIDVIVTVLRRKDYILEINNKTAATSVYGRIDMVVNNSRSITPYFIDDNDNKKTSVGLRLLEGSSINIICNNHGESGVYTVKYNNEEDIDFEGSKLYRGESNVLIYDINE